VKLLLALLLSLPALAAEVSGYVYFPDGRVAEGASVRTGNVTVITDKDGKFVLSELAEGVVELEITAKDAPVVRPLVLTGDVVSITLTEDQPRAQPTPGAGGEGTVSGKITVDGKPLANAPVLVSETRVTTNAKGEYVAKGLPAGRHVVTVDPRLFPRLRSSYAQRMFVEGTEPYMADLRNTRKATVDLALLAAPMIRGRVVDHEGKPVSRARVQLVIANRPALDFSFDATAARTAPDGRYAFPAPEWNESEQASVAVTPLLQSTFRSKPFNVGKADRTVDITLPKLETVRIRVLDRAGKPVSGARVMFAPSEETAASESLTYLVESGPNAPLSNADGEIVTQLELQTYEFAAAATGFQTGSVIKAIAKPGTVDITLERAAVLRGRVHRGEKGVGSVHVQVIGADRSSGTTNTSTDQDGTFELQGLAPGSYRIFFYKHEELIDRTLTVEAPGEMDVELPLTGKLRGRVIDAATGAPLRDFAASIDPTQPGLSGSVDSGYSSPDGTFTVERPGGHVSRHGGRAELRVEPAGRSARDRKPNHAPRNLPRARRHDPRTRDG
jgi:protocatechuate 3,4-dioxygenase beta subunit